ncbi:ribose ABC transporter permease [Agriterribacter sp.]|uniref:ABC transporter permease n=1 Tax=Agriterribacter sp. TaxID=2821509 RepID=UPI002D1D4469|nr:ribose ABC transporter permease [Agriterribacter sp.]HRP55820.1 ribose ABC transporter permease [Agriterribacter sp.]
MNPAKIKSSSGYLSRYGIFIAFVVICIMLSIATPYFFTAQNIIIVLRQVSINGILAIGVTFVIIAGGIDLSLGSVLALTGVVAASFAHPDTYSLVVPVMLGILTGVIIGAINGLTITLGKVAPFIVTLGMMTIARGLALVWSDGRPVTNLSPAFNYIGGGDFLRIPVPILLFVLVIIVSAVVLKYTRIGRYIYAVGGNENAAKASGIRVGAVKMFAYIMCSGLAGLAGIILASRITTGQPNAGIAYELDAIAAVVIGGTSLLGGRGSIAGTVIGVLIIGVINNGLDLLNVTSYYQQIIKGIIIIGAVLLDRKNAQ